MSFKLKIPVIGESVTEVTLTNWLKKDGEFIKEGENVCEIESEKASMELPAPTSGVLKITVAAGTELKIGDMIGELLEGKSDAVVVVAPPQTTIAPVATAIASPAASKILAEKGIEVAQVNGSGKDGRVTKEDAKNAAIQTSVAPSIKESHRGSDDRIVTKEKMSRLRKTIAAKLVEAKNTTAMLTTFNEVDMSALMDLRKKYKDPFKEKFGVNLGFMSFFTKACSMALMEYKAVNGQISGDEMVFFNYVDMGIAVSTPKGLVVPVVRNAQKLSLAEIEKEILSLAVKARDGKITIDEMQGGTFSITNGGVFGSMLSTPILNLPQSAILGMHNIVERPVAINGQVVIRPIMYVALSYDHRIIDGRESVSFLKKVKELLEDPSRLLLNV